RFALVAWTLSGRTTLQSHGYGAGGQPCGGTEIVQISGVDGALPDDGNLLPGAVDTCRVEKIQVVDGREVRGRQEVISAHVGGQVRVNFRARLGGEIVQRSES